LNLLVQCTRAGAPLFLLGYLPTHELKFLENGWMNCRELKFSQKAKWQK